MKLWKSDDMLLEKLVEVEPWARANLDVLRLREGDCFMSKLRQLHGGEEKRIHNFLANNRKRVEASAALAAQLAKLDCLVMARGDTGLHAAVPSAGSECRNARSSTVAGLSTQEEGRKRPKPEARALTDSVGRSDSCGSVGASNSDFLMTTVLGSSDTVSTEDPPTDVPMPMDTAEPRGEETTPALIPVAVSGCTNKEKLNICILAIFILMVLWSCGRSVGKL